MNKIIIFEGPDLCGKTEIGKALSKELKMSYFKNTAEHNSFREDSFTQSAFIESNYLFSLLNQINFPDNGIILDRHMPSEYVYSKVYNRKTNFDLIWETDNKFANLNTTIIYCFKTKYKDFNDEVISFDKIEKIKEMYEDYFSKTKIKVIRLNTTDENLEREIKEIKEKL
jgi:thymidylate kinase